MLNFDDYDTYVLLIKICGEYSIEPSGSIELEEYFKNLLAKYDGSKDEQQIVKWLREIIPKEFIACKERPIWIQGFVWPVIDGKPAVFLGQMDLKHADIKEFFHDDTSIYIFSAPNVGIITVLQQF